MSDLDAYVDSQRASIDTALTAYFPLDAAHPHRLIEAVRYTLLGGGLSVSGGASISGTGITFYNTFDSTHAYKPITVSGGSQTNISAPTSGLLAGILFFEDRSVTSTSQNTISGGSGAVFAGALYFPNSPLVYSGGSASAGAPYTIIVANTLTITGNSYFNNDYSSLPSGDPVKASATIVE